MTYFDLNTGKCVPVFREKPPEVVAFTASEFTSLSVQRYIPYSMGTLRTGSPYSTRRSNFRPNSSRPSEFRRQTAPDPTEIERVGKSRNLTTRANRLHYDHRPFLLSVLLSSFKFYVNTGKSAGVCAMTMQYVESIRGADADQTSFGVRGL